MQPFFRPRTMCFDRLILWAYYMLPQNKLSQMLVKVSCSCLGKKIQQLEKKKEEECPSTPNISSNLSHSTTYPFAAFCF